jgi:hypothetical protein
MIRHGLGASDIRAYLAGWVFVTLCFLGLTIFLVAEVLIPLGWTIWAWPIPVTVLVYGGLSVRGTFFIHNYMRDLQHGCTQLVGCVRNKWISERSVATAMYIHAVSVYHVDVEHLSFNWLQVFRRADATLLGSDRRQPHQTRAVR